MKKKILFASFAGAIVLIAVKIYKQYKRTKTEKRVDSGSDPTIPSLMKQKVFESQNEGLVN